jgi:hypothetical protein
MDKATLKRTRLFAPGIIVLVCLLPYLKLQSFSPVSDALPDGVLIILLTIASIIIGGVYYSFAVRDLLWRQFVKKCHGNVWTKMIMPHYQDPDIQAMIGQLTKKQAMRIFYNIIDNDSSLSDQAHDVRLNGAVLTTIIDILLIAGFFFITYICAFLIAKIQFFLWSAMITALLELLLWLLKSRVSMKHIRLENEQLEVIAQLHANKVLSHLRELK